MKYGRQVQPAAFVFVVVLYMAARLSGLTGSCLWFDEIFSVHAAEHSWDSILSFVALDLIHPPLFYVLLKLWIGVGGESLLWLRLFPVVFAVIAIFPFISLCRELRLSVWTQILALFLFAVNGSLIKYAQEVRMYSPLMCLSLFSMWLFLRYFNKGKSCFPLLIVNLLLVYIHYFGWFVVAAEIIAILVFQRTKLRRILTMFAIIFASFVPWIVAIWQAAHAGSELGQNIGWMTRPGPTAIVQFVLNLIEPFYYQASNADAVSIFKISLPILLIAVIAFCFYFASWKRQSNAAHQTVKLLVLLVALPLAVAFAASWLLPCSIWGTRHLIIVFAPFSILFAIVLTRIPTSKLKTAAITLILLFSGYAFSLRLPRKEPQYIWCAWEKLTNDLILTPHYSPERKRLYVFEDLVAYHFWFGLRDFENYEVIGLKGVDDIAQDPAYFLPRGFDGIRSMDLSQVSDVRLWIAFREPKRPEISPGLPFIGPPAGPAVSALSKLGFVVDEVHKVEVGDQVAYLMLMLKDPRFAERQQAAK